ncbi:response regulator [Anabaena sphaerica FACHB-251]|uniref:Protein PatA n=1 Tax=Anabaena sphaerica FACHB-251 TaxID=2692883 RepID=A0A926WLB0_9NOST|nr:response regulator [Anabaena sphaerica]MBD2295273.1 response regulator [Anabaena sphaerica FACHB-251]
MDNYQVMESNKLIKEFNISTQFKYTGQLKVKNSQGKTWKIYYQIGKIVWATGGTHPYRRWLRNIAQHCPQIDLNNIQHYAEDILVDYWDYLLLENLFATQKIRQQQINNIVESTITEVLFDLAQQTNSSSLSFERNQEMILKSPLISTNGNMFLKQMQECWHKWLEAGLADICPYLAPVLQKPEQLKQQVSPLVYTNFQRLINGKYTLWELAVKMKQSVLSVARSLLPYIQQGIVNLIELPDAPLPTNKVSKIHQVTEENRTNSPLVACLDDSPQVCKMLERIITSHGMRFIGIQHPLQALPTLIEKKPDLIFLDLMMPVVNGYEVCNQLRRISFFAKTPVVILTSSDGVFDRVRSKVFGATEFITKPVETDKVIEIVDKYLQPALTVDNLSNLAFSY